MAWLSNRLTVAPLAPAPTEFTVPNGATPGTAVSGCQRRAGDRAARGEAEERGSTSTPPAPFVIVAWTGR